jgi:endonuclease/exonuclease/phosphatase (EEP) superfamily protein YafD
MLLVSLLVVALGVGARWVDGTGILPLIQALFPCFGVLALVLLVVALVARYPWLILLAILVALPPLVLGTASLGSSTVAAGPQDEVVMTANLELGHADARQVIAAVRRAHVTTLILQECTPTELHALETDGLDAVLPQQAGVSRPGIRGTVVRSVHRLHLVAEHPAGRFPSSPDVEVATRAGDYRLRAVHTPAPLPNIVSDWRSALRSLAQWRAALPGSQRLVMAGDFNASRAMPGFRQVADGLIDASTATGSGWRRTWPNGKAIPPFVQLDHVLSRGFGVVADGTTAIGDTDHLAYWARLRITPVTRAAAR